MSSNKGIFGLPKWYDVNNLGSQANTNATRFVPNAAFGTITGFQSALYRVADRLKGEFRFVCGTTTGATAAIALPSGLSINSGFYGTNSWPIGFYWYINSGAGDYPFYSNDKAMVAVYDGSDRNNMYFVKSGQSGAIVKQAGSGLVAADNSVMWFKVDIAIAEWAA